MSTKSKFHRDGTVTVWNVFTQQHEHVSAEDLVMRAGGAGATPQPNAVLPTLPENDRQRIFRMAGRNIEESRRAMRYSA